MVTIANRRSGMVLFSGPLCPDSHRVRMVIAEKGINVDIAEVGPGELPQELLDINPHGTLPTLCDREAVLYEPRIVMEYLDERFPHPPLMPVDPVSRARYRLTMYRIERDYYDVMAELDSRRDKGRSDKRSQVLRKQLTEHLTASDPAFAVKPFFLSDEFSLVDCCMVPVLWRLPRYGIDIPKQATATAEYAERMFDYEPFKRSLTEGELEIREG